MRGPQRQPVTPTLLRRTGPGQGRRAPDLR